MLLWNKCHNLTFNLSLVTTWSGVVQQTPILEVWKYDVRSTNTNQETLQIGKYFSPKKWSTSKFGKEHQHSFVCKPNTEDLEVVSHLKRCVHAHVLPALLRHFLAVQYTHQWQTFHPGIQHSAEHSALVRCACPNLRLRTSCAYCYTKPAFGLEVHDF